MSISKRRFLSACCLSTTSVLAAGLILSWGFVAPAAADVPTHGDPVLSTVAELAPEVLLGVSEEAFGAKEGVILEAVSDSGSRASVASDPEAGVSFSGSAGTWRMTIPLAEDASEGVSSSIGSATFENESGPDTMVLAKDDGSIQVITVIAEPTSPTEYRYEFDLPPGAVMLDMEGGGVAIVSVEGDWLGGIAPPWARDAGGNPVETWYVISGSTLTQFVAHGPENLYPVVADPWLNIDLISSFKWVKSSQGWTISVAVTPWMGAVDTSIAGTFGWEELKTKVRASNLTSFNRLNTWAMQQQWNCHAAGKAFIGVAGWLGIDKRPTWDLETWRPATYDPTAFVRKMCNW